MRFKILLLAILMPHLLAGVALAASPQDISNCRGDDPDRAIAGCTGVLQTPGEPAESRASALNNRGNAFGEKGDYPHAIADFNAAIQLEPNVAAFYNDRGFAYASVKDSARAFTDYRKAVELDPNYPTPHYNLGNWYNDGNNLDSAITEYTNAITLNKNYGEAYFNRSIAEARKLELDGGNDIKARDAALDRIITDITAAIRLSPHLSAQAYNNLCSIFQAKGDADQAIANCTQAISFNANDAYAYENRSLAKRAKGDMAGADADIAKARELGIR